MLFNKLSVLNTRLTHSAGNTALYAIHAKIHRTMELNYKSIFKMENGPFNF